MGNEDTTVKENAELGAMAYLNQDELERKVRMTGEVLELVHGIVADLVRTLPDDDQKEYSEDLTRIAELLPFIR